MIYPPSRQAYRLKVERDFSKFGEIITGSALADPLRS
jgi:hypothetical protein